MGVPKISKVTFFVICFALILAFSAVTTRGQQSTNISGKISAVNIPAEPISIGDTEGHAVNLLKSEGTNKSTGEQAFMDGAHVFNISFSDVVKGSGRHLGYVIFANDSDTTIAKWEGEVNTISDTEGKSTTNVKGTFTYIYGAGKYKGISGSGTYVGHFTSKTEYAVEWQGSYTLDK